MAGPRGAYDPAEYVEVAAEVAQVEGKWLGMEEFLYLKGGAFVSHGWW